MNINLPYSCSSCNIFIGFNNNKNSNYSSVTLPEHQNRHEFLQSCIHIKTFSRYPELLKLSDANVISVDWQTMVVPPWYNYAVENVYRVSVTLLFSYSRFKECLRSVIYENLRGTNIACCFYLIYVLLLEPGYVSFVRRNV